MPGFKSFISRTSLLKIGSGISALGSRAGFSNSFKISVRVNSPIPSSSAICFLFLTRFSRFPTLTVSFSAATSLFASLSSLTSSVPASACIKAAPIAEFLFLITNCGCFFFLSCFLGFSSFLAG